MSGCIIRLMLKDVAYFISKESLLAPDAPVLLGVSGGLDSMAAFQILQDLGIPLICAHFDHHLRPESAEDARFVRAAAERAGIPFVLGEADERFWEDHRGSSLEEAARRLRYRFLFRAARVMGAQAVATAHTADDQVETALMHFLRGAGLSGLTGMRPRTVLPEFDEDIPVVRPFLETERKALEAYCKQVGVPYRDDPTNTDQNFYRNRLRHSLIPELETYQPQFRSVLLRNTRVLAMEDAALERILDDLWSPLCLREEVNCVAIDRRKFVELPEGLQARALRRAISILQPSLRDVDYAGVMRGLRTANGAEGAQCDLTGGLQLMVEGGRFWIGTDWDALPDDLWPQVPSDAPLTLSVPSELLLGKSWLLQARFVLAGVGEPATIDCLDWPAEIADAPLLVRGRRAGERFRPAGMGGRLVALADYMINEKIPRRARARWPLVVSGDRVLWVVGKRAAENEQAPIQGERILRLLLRRR